MIRLILYSSVRTEVSVYLYLGKIFKAASHKGVRTSISCHFNSILDETQKFHRKLMNLQNITEHQLYVLS